MRASFCLGGNMVLRLEPVECSGGLDFSESAIEQATETSTLAELCLTHPSIQVRHFLVTCILPTRLLSTLYPSHAIPCIQTQP